MKIQVQSKAFRNIVSATNNVYSKGATIKVYQNMLEIVAASIDNSISICSAISILNPNDINLNGQEFINLYVSDLTKFIKLLDMSNSEIFEFEVKNNFIYFKSDNICGAKFILDDIPPQKLPASANYKKFAKLKPKYSATITKNKVKDVVQASSFANSSDKVYFYQKDDKLIAELNDRTLANIDNISIILAENGTGNIDKGVIVSVDAFSSIITSANELFFGIIDISARNNNIEALLISIPFDGGFIKYLFNSKLR